MFNVYQKLINKELKQVFKLYRHNKCKYLPKSIKTFKQPNLTYLHVSHNFNLVRGIQTSSHLSGRIYKDSENVYAYNILQTIPIVDKDIFVVKSPNEVITTLDDFNSLLDQNWRIKSSTEIVEGFKSALNYCTQNDINVSDQRFDKLVDGLVDHVQDLTDSELLELLDCLIEYPLCDSYTAHNFHDIWSALDDVCIWKIPNWSTETMFMFADRWYRLNLGKVGNYINELVKRLSRKPERLTKAQLIHTFFYVNICRKQFVDFNYENALQKHINTFNADEMAIAAMGFFKSQSPIKLKFLLQPMIAQIKKECHTIHEITLTAILKVLRYSSHVLLIDQLMDLLDHLVPEIDRLSNLCCVHMALLGTTLQFFHKKSLEKISQKLINHISDPKEMRLKDIERLLVALTMFDFNPDTNVDIYEAISKEIQMEDRRKEFLKYIRCLPSILNLLSMRKIYCYDLMNEVLCSDRIVEIYSKYPKHLSRDVLSLDVCIEAECPDYKGNRLNKTFRQKASKWMVEYTPTWDQYKKLTSADKFYLTVQDTVAKIVHGPENIHTDHILPNFVKSDIIICLNKDGNFIQPSGFEDYILGDVMQAPNPDLRWYAIIPVNWNNVIRNTTEPLGLIKMKCRLLKAVGYEPIMIIWSEFQKLQEKEKIEYIKNKIT
ncbi:hypothetical protein ILUMI_05763 [Ignelater luminosus]|uniref:RAP domain-containing protein n=1 Tax=Ignelater luminosus TaxID=2038154 RepID=A0A8K0D9W0_IGNLU|nr:hypothetical protein ILUMI_05763 [Ignelater luminosus]